MCKYLTVLCLVLTCGLMAADAPRWVPITSDEPLPPQWEVWENTAERIGVTMRLPGYFLETVEVDGQPHALITLPGGARFQEPGAPDLPLVRANLRIPDTARMELRNLSVRSHEAQHGPCAPSKGPIYRNQNPEEIPYTFGKVYERNTPWPAEAGRLDAPFILRNARGVPLQLHPVRYDPARQVWTIAEEITAEIVAAGEDPETGLTPDRKVRESKEFADIYGTRFINNDDSRYPAVGEVGPLLIITYDAFYDAMLPFYYWKLQKGIPTKMVTVTAAGGTAANIKNYILNEYQTYGLTYVLLVGDYQQVPFMTGTAGNVVGNPSDPSYALLTGNDQYYELFVSRFSAQNATQVQVQVNKVLNYEKTAQAGGAWYHQAFGIGGDDTGGSPPYADWQRVEFLRAVLQTPAYHYTDFDQIYHSSATAAQVTTAVNAGRGLGLYIGHGSETAWGTTGFNVTNVNALTNTSGMLPFIVSVACVNGRFNYSTTSDCFAEAWLKAGTPASPKGAVAFYGSSTNQSWVPPCDGQREIVDRLAAETYHTIGALYVNGCMKAIDLWPGTGEGSGAELCQSWHIFGDASLQVFTDTPAAMAVMHDGVLPVGQATYAVAVPGVPGALCALYNEATHTLHGSAYADDSGNAVIPLDPVPGEGMTLKLTVTAFNRLPVFGTVEVIVPSGPWLQYVSHAIDDSAGNGDGVVNPGETIVMPVTLGNIGAAAGTGIAGVLTEASVYAAVTDGAATWPDIPVSGSMPSNPNHFAFTVAPEAPDGHVIPFTVAWSATGGYSGTVSIPVPVRTPVLGFHGHAVSDACAGGGEGNADGVIDAGETVTLAITLNNEGSVAATGVTGILSTAVPGVTVTDPSAAFANIAPGGTGASGPNQFAFSVADTVPCGTPIPFGLHLASNENPAGWDDTFTLTVGTVLSGDGTALEVNFSSGLPAGWTVVDGGSGGGAAATWTTANPGNRTPVAPITTPFAIVDSDYAGSTATQNEQLITPSMNLSNATTVTLEFDQYFHYIAGYGDEYGDVDVKSSRTGGAWVNVFRNHGADSPNPDHQTINITTQAAGAADVQVRFYYYGGAWDYYWMVDNVQVAYTAPGGCLMTVCPVVGPAVQYDGTFDPNATLTELCGDGDMTVEPGEAWRVTVRLKNTGSAPATAVAASLAVNPGSAVGATLLAGNPGAYGTLAPGGTGTAVYDFRVDPEAECGETITFDLTAISSVEQGYPPHPAAFQTGVGWVVPGGDETGTQQTEPLEASQGMASSAFGPTGFTLAEADAATLSYIGGYEAGSGATETLFGPDASPATSGFWTGSLSSQSSDHCGSNPNPYNQIANNSATALAVNVSTVGYTNIHVRFDAGASSRFVTLYLDYSIDGGATYVSLWSRTNATQWLCDADVALPAACANIAALRIRFRTGNYSGTAGYMDNIRITGDAPGEGSWTANAQVALISPAGTPTVLKAFGAADASPYDVKTAYTGPGTYRLRVEENGGGTARVTGGEMRVVQHASVECDAAVCGGGQPPGEVSPPGSVHPLRLVKDAQCGGVCLYFQKAAAMGYNVYAGTIGAWYSHGDGRICGVTADDQGDGTMRYALGTVTGDRYYLVTAHNGILEGTAGSPGRDAQCVCP